MNRYEVWLDLIAKASERTTTWLVWKNADSALHGSGDVDAFCDSREFPIVEETFAEWAKAWRLGPAFVCGHIPGGSNLVALAEDERLLLEVGTKQWKSFRGSALVTHTDLIPWVRWDERGFRGITLGSETALKLVLNGVAPGGKPNWAALRAKGVLEGIRTEPEGLRDFVSFLPSLPTTPTLALAHAASEGRWDRTSALQIEAHAILRSVRRTSYVAKRAAFKFGPSKCPIVRSLGGGRRVEGDTASWVRIASSTHQRIA